MKRMLPGALVLILFSGPALTGGAGCDRECLKGLLDRTFVSMAKHDASLLPLAPRYRLTVDNVPSGAAMATPWRTISGYVTPGPGQYAIDTKQQEVAFLVLVNEGGLPATVAGRIKAEGNTISEVELYVGRSKADSGLQFAPTDVAKLPRGWTTSIPAGSRRASREELSKIGMGAAPAGGAATDCAMMENGHVVADYISVDAWSHMAPHAPAEATEEIRRRNEAARGGPIGFGCTPDAALQADAQRRTVVDEVQGIVATFALVNGEVVPNFLPPPGPNPEYPTAFVPNFAKDDLAWRVASARNPPQAATGSYAEPMPAVLSVVLFVRIFDGKMQGLDRYMQAQPVGSTSPWYTRP